MSYVQVRNLSKSFDNNQIFNNINFDIHKGEFISLLGPSGCGKSTLLRSIAGLHSVDSGNVYVDGEDITYKDVQKRNIGMVFQSYALFPNLNVFDNIAFGLKLKKLSKEVIRKKVLQIIELVDLTGKENYYIDALSGGQKQRVALARALVVEPNILLLDEPLSALDAKIRKKLRTMIRQIQQELNLTTIFVTHDQEEAMIMSDRIFLMDKGNIIQQGSPIDIYTNPVNKFAATFIGNYNILKKKFSLKYFNLDCQTAIRPEAITLAISNTDVIDYDYCLNGRISNIQLLGNIIRYNVKLDDFSLNVDELNDINRMRFFKQDAVKLYFKTKDIQPLKDTINEF